MKRRLTCAICFFLVLVSIRAFPEGTSAPGTDGASKTVVQVLTDAGNCTTFLTILKVGGMDAPLKAGDTFTIFAPTDDAFKKMAATDLKILMTDKFKAREFADCHFTLWKETTSDLGKMVGQKLTMMVCKSRPVGKEGDSLTIGSAKIVKSDLHAVGATIQLIDGVLWPKQ